MRQSRLYNSITPWCSGLLQKLTGSQLVKELPHFMKTDGSLLQSQYPATCSNLNPNQSSLCPQSHFLKIPFNIILPSTHAASSKYSLSLSISLQNPARNFPLPNTCYMPRPSHYSYGEEYRS